MKYDIRKFLLKFASPVGNKPLLFTIVTICCVAAPIVARILGDERHPRFAIFAFMQGCLWGWLVCVVSRRIRWMGAIIAAVFLLTGLIEIFHYILLDYCLDIYSIRLVTGTDATEIQGFFHQFFNPARWCGFAIGMIVITGICVAVYRFRFTVNIGALGAFTLLTVVTGGCVCAFQNLSIIKARSFDEIVLWQQGGSNKDGRNNLARLPYSDPVCKTVSIACHLLIERHEVKTWSRLQRLLYDKNTSTDTKPDSLNIIVVIGESFIRNHSSLYGYRLNVNPRLENEFVQGALAVFTDVTSPANFTVPSVENILNLNSLSEGEKWRESAYFPMIFACAGWDVELFTNQYVTTDNSDLSKIFFDPLMIDSVYARYNKHRYRYDGLLIAAMTDSFNLNRPQSQRTLTIWHLHGQHFPPRDQIPPASQRPFSIDDIPPDKPWLTPERRTIVADYANATFYNDSVIGAIIDLYRNRPAVLFYFSDHGEEMWDNVPFGNRNRQRPENADWMRRQHDVPMFVWMSQPLRQRRPDLWERINKCSLMPISLDIIGHTLLGIAGISSPHYHNHDDILSPSYRPRQRITSFGYKYPEKQKSAH